MMVIFLKYFSPHQPRDALVRSRPAGDYQAQGIDEEEEDEEGNGRGGNWKGEIRGENKVETQCKWLK